MPRVSQAHEQQVRERIVAAALRVFSERGFHRATMQDVVRESGLSVGAIYTYFTSKGELFLAGCDLTSNVGLGELANRLAGGRSVLDKLAIGIGYFFDAQAPIDPNAPAVHGLPAGDFMVQAWAEADQDAAVREALGRRRAQLVTVGQLLLREAMAKGEAPAWIDPEAITYALLALLDGLLLQRVEMGDAWRRTDMERRATAVLELLLAATHAPERPAVPAIPPQQSSRMIDFATDVVTSRSAAATEVRS